MDSKMFTWRRFLKEAGISSEFCIIYEDIFEKNRIDKEMLPDLTKEYLNAMSIEAVGDVIKILKHSKLTCESERNRILKAKISEPALETPVSKSSVSSSSAGQKTARRVLPEHEGKYKIRMPAGTTAKSRAIIAKMQSDKHEKKSIFDRLTSPNSSSDVEISSTSPDIILKKKSPSGQKKSIFNRLGNYKGLEVESKSKISWPSAPRGIVKPSMRSTQLKATTPKKIVHISSKMNEDVAMESEKQVTFSPEVTLRVYEPQTKPPPKKILSSSVKSRLGGKHGSLGIIRAPMKKASPLKVTKMKSDMMRKESIHSRLSHNKSSQKSIFKRLGD